MVDLKKKKDSFASSNKAKMLKAVSLAETKNWYKDRHQIVIIQRNILLVFTIVCLVGLVGLVNYVAVLSDSKIFEPFVIEVEDKTGIVTRVDSRSVANLTGNESVIRSLLARYVDYRESYAKHSYYYNYHKSVRVLSSGDVYRDFRYAIARNNPDSPINLQDKARRQVEIKSISFLEKDKAQVRFVMFEKEYPAGKLIREKHYIITTSFKFSPNKNLSQKERYINPLGFEITGYSKDEEFVQ